MIERKEVWARFAAAMLARVSNNMDVKAAAGFADQMLAEYDKRFSSVVKPPAEPPAPLKGD